MAMTNIFALFGVAAVVIVAFDAVACVVSKSRSIEYGRFVAGSRAIYFAVGLVAGFTYGWPYGLAAGAVTGFADSTVGWRVSWVMGPGRWHRKPTRSEVMKVVLFVTLMAATFAMAGGFLGDAALRWAFRGVNGFQ